MSVPALRVVMAQLNPVVGDLEANLGQVLEAMERARDELGAHAVVFPELTTTAYPPEDLLLRPAFLAGSDAALQRVALAARGIDVIIGHPERSDGALYNAASVLRDGAVLARYRKQILPNYGVFDEVRYFRAGSAACVFELRGLPVAITVCEDLWVPGPAAQARAAGARLMLNLNGSPFHDGKRHQRAEVLACAAAEAVMPIVYVNQVGGQDDLVFDGGSQVVDAAGRVRLQAPYFETALLACDFAADGTPLTEPTSTVPATDLDDDALVYAALVTGVRDYVRKNGFQGVVLGLSGGVDSALSLCIAVDALGAGQVLAVLMPSRHTADMSNEDAIEQCRRLGVAHQVLPIEGPYEAFRHVLYPVLGDTPPDITEENLQARCRGVLLMAISNRTGRLVLSTSNKSESAVGYSTLYGDMAGGFAPIKDCSKTRVYRLTRWRNRGHEVIPLRVIERAPSAELRPNQTDQDSLPPYDLLDAILERYVERDQSVAAIIREGFPEADVLRVARLVDTSEYKRRQAAPGVRVTARAFGRDRRYPITCRYRE